MTNFIRALMLASVFGLSMAAPAAQARTLPSRPVEAENPGSASYRFAAVERKKLTLQGRAVDILQPAGGATGLPVVIFGHGQAMGFDPYVKLFEHVVRRGAVVVFPMYDTGLFDRDFRRMARDYATLGAAAIRELGATADPAQVIFSGHSKGAYVALNALGYPEARQALAPRQAVLFAVAGSDREALGQVPAGIPVTFLIGDKDTITPQRLTDEAFAGISARPKQRIVVSSYATTSPTLDADHFYLITGSFLTVRKTEGPLHWYGAWRWLAAAVEDVRAGSRAESSWLWGDRALETGVEGARHRRD